MGRNSIILILGLSFMALIGYKLFTPQEQLEDLPTRDVQKQEVKPEALKTIKKSPRQAATPETTAKKPEDDSRKKNPAEDRANTEAPTKLSRNYTFKEVFSNQLKNEGIDYKFIEGGTPFQADLNNLKAYEVGKEIKLNLNAINLEFEGKVTKNFVSGDKTSTVSISFPYDGEDSLVTFHYSPDGKVEGKLYSSQGNYEFVHNGDVGYFISFEEMERLEQLELER